jgi:Fe-S-cluster containining protein
MTLFRDDAGRAHLVLHRDPTTGRNSVNLKKPLHDEQWLNETVAASASTVLGVLAEEPTPERVTEAARRLMALTSKLVDRLLTLAPDGAVACKAGCGHCCHQVVGISVPEALAIWEHLQRTRSRAELEHLKARVAALHERAQGRSVAERFSADLPCAFLRDGSCSIYEVRPIACRGANSLDAAECEERLRDPRARAEFIEKGHGGRCYVEPVQAFRAVSTGLQLGVSELYRLDPRGLDLLAAMHVLLRNETSLAEAWVAGGQPFEEALREKQKQDATENARGG